MERNTQGGGGLPQVAEMSVDDIKHMISQETRRVVSTMDLASKQDLARLEREISELKLLMMGRRQTGGESDYTP